MTRPQEHSGRGWQWLLVVGVLAFGCGGADDRPNGSAIESEEGPAGSPTTADDDADDADQVDVPSQDDGCESGTVEECRIEIAEVAGVKNCAIGLRLCEDGKWSACSRESEINARLTEDDPES